MQSEYQALLFNFALVIPLSTQSIRIFRQIDLFAGGRLHSPHLVIEKKVFKCFVKTKNATFSDTVHTVSVI